MRDFPCLCRQLWFIPALTAYRPFRSITIRARVCQEQDREGNTQVRSCFELTGTGLLQSKAGPDYNCHRPEML